MEISVKIDELKKKSIFVAVPMYGGQCYGMFMKAALDLQGLCMQYGIQVKFSFLFNESLVTRCRNYLADEFINRSNCTHMLFIDADVHFDPQDVLVMLALDTPESPKDIIGGPYPKKTIKWKNVKTALKRNPNLDDGQLAALAGDFVFNPVMGTQQFSVSDPLKVLEIGTGFMMIKREVFTKLREAYPQLKYKPDHVGQAHFDGSRFIHAYFDCVIDTPTSITGGNTFRYLSEDYMFCQIWRKLGGEIWLCPWMKTKHCGTIHFEGDMQAIAQHVGEM